METGRGLKEITNRTWGLGRLRRGTQPNGRTLIKKEAGRKWGKKSHKTVDGGGDAGHMKLGRRLVSVLGDGGIRVGRPVDPLQRPVGDCAGL